MEWLDKLLTPGVLGAIAVIVCAVASVMIVFAVIFRERISGVSVSRTEHSHRTQGRNRVYQAIR